MLLTAFALSAEIVAAGMMTGVKGAMLTSVGMDAEAGITMDVV